MRLCSGPERCLRPTQLGQRRGKVSDAAAGVAGKLSKTSSAVNATAGCTIASDICADAEGKRAPSVNLAARWHILRQLRHTMLVATPQLAE